MKFILLPLFCFFGTLMFLEFKKNKKIKNFTKLVKGKVNEIVSLDNGTFFYIEYPVTNTKEVLKIYEHKFSPVKMPEDKVLFLVEKFLHKPFFLFGKEENGEISDVLPYTYTRATKWVYLILSLLVGYFLFLF